jgi:hypothetical protein
LGLGGGLIARPALVRFVAAYQRSAHTRAALRSALRYVLSPRWGL